MKPKITKTQAKDEIEKFFNMLNLKDGEDVRKIKRLAMKFNIPLDKYKKDFCKKCLLPYKTPRIRINGGMKSVTCNNCNNTSRWKLK